MKKMFGSKKTPLDLNVGKHNSVGPPYPVASTANPFDSNEEFDTKPKLSTPRRTSSEPVLSASSADNYNSKGVSSSLYPSSLTSARNRYRNDFHDSGGLENQSVQELENYAVYKAGETTKDVNNCLRIAESMREDATRTLVMLHEQGEQITRSHAIAADIDHDLSRGEKLLGSLGGIFSKTWKPKKSRQITGPLITRDNVQRKGSSEQREKLGLTSTTKQQSNTRTPVNVETDALKKVEVEKSKQDDALTDLSNILGELKDMAIDMGTEMDWQNKALDPFHDDVEELNKRVEQANRRGRHLLRK